MRTRLVLLALPVIFAAACTPAANTAAPAGPSIAEQQLTARVAELQARIAETQAPPADSKPRVYFANLKSGDTVTSPFRVVFGLSGMGVAPALVEKENTGHHHLLIDTTLSAEQMQFAIPNDDQHRHFGLGQTETVVELALGQHTLQLVFGDLNHELHKPDPILSERITITVK
jgi:hypothetical protein